jgi:hypothetical protein
MDPILKKAKSKITAFEYGTGTYIRYGTGTYIRYGTVPYMYKLYIVPYNVHAFTSRCGTTRSGTGEGDG